MSEERTERQVAAATTWLLLVNGCIDRRRYNAHQLSVVIGVSIEELDEARQICETQGYEALRPRDGSPAPSGRTESRGRAQSNPEEKRCAACGEFLPIDRFAKVEGSRRREPLCDLCTEFRARDHWVAIQKGTAIKMLTDHYAALITAEVGDAFVGDTCTECGRRLVVGERIRIEGQAVHDEC